MLTISGRRGRPAVPGPVRGLHGAVEQLLGRAPDRRVGAVGGAEVDAAEAPEGAGGAHQEDTGRTPFSAVVKFLQLITRIVNSYSVWGSWPMTPGSAYSSNGSQSSQRLYWVDMSPITTAGRRIKLD